MSQTPLPTTEALEVDDNISKAVAVAPRVSLESMKAKIAETHFILGYDIIDHEVEHDMVEAANAAGKAHPRDTHPLSVLTICVIVMQNGFTVIGKAAPASPENFNAEVGRKFAYEDALRQIWPLEGYALREALYHAPVNS